MKPAKSISTPKPTLPSKTVNKNVSKKNSKSKKKSQVTGDVTKTQATVSVVPVGPVGLVVSKPDATAPTRVLRKRTATGERVVIPDLLDSEDSASDYVEPKATQNEESDSEYWSSSVEEFPESDPESLSDHSSYGADSSESDTDSDY